MTLQIPADLFLQINISAEEMGLTLRTWLWLAAFRMIGEEAGADEVQR